MALSVILWDRRQRLLRTRYGRNARHLRAHARKYFHYIKTTLLLRNYRHVRSPYTRNVIIRNTCTRYITIHMIAIRTNKQKPKEIRKSTVEIIVSYSVSILTTQHLFLYLEARTSCDRMKKLYNIICNAFDSRIHTIKPRFRKPSKFLFPNRLGRRDGTVSKPRLFHREYSAVNTTYLYNNFYITCGKCIYCNVPEFSSVL